MQDRAFIDFTPPHPRPSFFIWNYIEKLMQLTYEHPHLLKYSIYLMGAMSATLAPSYWLLPSILGTPVKTAGVLSMAGGVGTLFAAMSGALQHHIFGFPFEDDSVPYQASEYRFGSAIGNILLDEKKMPLVHIKSDNYYDAGYVEGYILAKAIQHNLEHLNRILNPLLFLLGSPSKDEALGTYLAEILKTIPEVYQQEMRGKVAGFNSWLKENNVTVPPLLFERYLLIQLLPDLSNYNPFKKNLHLDVVPDLGCTTVAIGLDNYTLFTRILDWPSYGVANYFFQIDREIVGVKRTRDIGHPLTSGGLTIVNENNVLIEINISPNNSIKEVKGMPSIFFNRYCAENVTSVKDIEDIVAKKQPLNAYHLTATDGIETKSFHFYQSNDCKNPHVIESLKKDVSSPQLLVVANQGVCFTNYTANIINHKDSAERKENINSFFNQCLNQSMTHYLKKQKTQKLSSTDIAHLKEMCINLAKYTPLVNNCESVLCAIYIYYKDQLLEASAVTDNIFAPHQGVKGYRELRI